MRMLLIFFAALPLFSQQPSEIQFLEWDIENGDVPRVIAFLEDNPLPQELPSGSDPLLYTLDLGHREMVREMLRRIPVQGSRDGDLILGAAALGRLDLVDMLASLGVDLRARNSLGENALYGALQSPGTRMLDYLLQQDLDPFVVTFTGRNLLMSALQYGNTLGFQRLLELGLEPSQVDYFGRGLGDYLTGQTPDSLRRQVLDLTGEDPVEIAQDVSEPQEISPGENLDPLGE